MIWGLEEFADAEYQERVWAGNGRGEMSSFEEALTATFDNSRLDQILYTGRGTDQLSLQMLALARKLNIAVQKVPQLGPAEAILGHHAMADVRLIAKEMLSLIESEGLVPIDRSGV
ncbi:hypothetical protein [Kaistia terrae]|uniref:Uncharacterized protein n=1 Tax=Kaistia terrae TaxID=537017 RepID=A0ABW0Q0K4_9HYPH|nr:hypothetical protein [Kaistia terrae]MCX5580474.1 hypothetical protein [Kaistia terrae]